jgi:hypothetical protein
LETFQKVAILRKRAAAEKVHLQKKKCEIKTMARKKPCKKKIGGGQFSKLLEKKTQQRSLSFSAAQRAKSPCNKAAANRPFAQVTSRVIITSLPYSKL